MNKTPRSFKALLLIIGLSCTLTAQASPLNGKEGNPLAQLSDAFKSLSERVGEAVVQVSVVRYRSPSSDIVSSSELLAREYGKGSGVIVSKDGYIVTNAHLIDRARSVKVLVPTTKKEGEAYDSILKPKRTQLEARIVGTDKETDLAVLKVDQDSLPFLQFADSEELKQGEIVLAFGSPLGLENSVSMGVISSVARQLRPDDPMIYIQTDAPINPGNSGGALADTNGNVVGINTLNFSHSGGDEGIGFAAPSNIVQHVYREIREHGRVRRSHIGVSAQTVTPTLARGLGLASDWGVIVADVSPGQPADWAGLQIGDVILKVDGKVMENARQFDVNIYQRAPGTDVELEILRNSQKILRRVSTIARGDEPDDIIKLSDPQENLIHRLGIVAVEVEGKVADMLPFRKSEGVIIAVMAADGSARVGGLLPGDVLYSLNGNPIRSLAGLRAQLEDLKMDDPIVFQIQRQEKLMFVAFEP